MSRDKHVAATVEWQRFDYENGETIWQRECPDCDRGLLLAPARFCSRCGGSGYLTATADPTAATASWPERVIVDGREVPVVIDPMLPDHVGVCEWNLDFQGNPTTPKRIVLRSRNERVLLHEVLHCLLGDNEALVRRATLLYDLGWRLPVGAGACECDAPRCERDGCQDKPTEGVAA